MIAPTKFLIIAGIATCTAFGSASAQKIGFVDMNMIFEKYSETQDAQSKIQEAQESARKELDEKMETFKSNVEAINKLNQEVENKALSEQARAEKAAERDKRITETREMERKLQEFRQQREKQLQDQMQRMRKTIVDKIIEVVQDKVKEADYDIVMDKSGLSSNLVPIVLFSKDDMDFSQSIIDELNAKAGE